MHRIGCQLFGRASAVTRSGIDGRHRKNLPQYVRGDAPRVRQIFVDLIGNAIKFTQRGDICVRATLSHDPGDAIGLPTQSNDGNAIVPVQFEVIDAGSVSPKKLKR